MKNLLASVLIAMSLSACQTAHQQQADFEQRYTVVKDKVANAKHCDFRLSADTGFCAGKVADQTLAEQGIPRSAGAPFSLIGRQIGERVDDGVMSEADGAAYFFNALDQSVRGRRVADLELERQQSQALSQALLGASAQYNAMQVARQPAPVPMTMPTTTNCHRYGQNLTCRTW